MKKQTDTTRHILDVDGTDVTVDVYWELEDEGIGSYEFWGATGTHQDWQWNPVDFTFIDGEADADKTWQIIEELEYLEQ